MENKLFNSLKQTYARVGLSESILKGQAAWLHATGLVTDQNLETVVLAQKPFLEALQSGIDQRVALAVAKVKGRSERTRTQPFGQPKGMQQMIEAALEEKITPIRRELENYRKREADRLQTKERGFPKRRMNGAVSATHPLSGKVVSDCLSGAGTNRATGGLYNNRPRRAGETRKTVGGNKHPGVVNDGFHVLHFTEKMIHSEFKKVLMNLIKAYE